MILQYFFYLIMRTYRPIGGLVKGVRNITGWCFRTWRRNDCQLNDDRNNGVVVVIDVCGSMAFHPLKRVRVIMIAALTRNPPTGIPHRTPTTHRDQTAAGRSGKATAAASRVISSNSSCCSAAALLNSVPPYTDTATAALVTDPRRTGLRRRRGGRMCARETTPVG